MQTALIADDHPLFREAVRNVVRRVFSQLGWLFECLEAASIQEALSLVDLLMPGTRDLSGLIALRARLLSTPLVVVSSVSVADTVQRAITCGAAGFIPKSSSTDQMVEALRTVLAGGVYVPPGDSREVPGARRHPAERCRPPRAI